MTVKHGLVQTISGTRNVWNLKVASKINMFAWKTLKRALPVGTRFVKCHIDVWRDATFAMGFDPRGIERNKFVFNGCSASPVYILATAIKAAKEWDQMHKVEKGSSPLPPSITAVQHSASFITPTTEVQQKKTVWHVAYPLMAEGLAIREALVLALPALSQYPAILHRNNRRMFCGLNEAVQANESEAISISDEDHGNPISSANPRIPGQPSSTNNMVNNDVVEVVNLESYTDEDDALVYGGLEDLPCWKNSQQMYGDWRT
ncbi:hypothetical protein YC2023_092661 [Brassica napus]